MPVGVKLLFAVILDNKLFQQKEFLWPHCLWQLEEQFIKWLNNAEITTKEC